MNRRNFLKTAGVGGGALLVAGSSAGGWRAHQAGLIAKDNSPFAPWDALDTAQHGDPAVLAAAAILASNPHNTQPWRIAVDDTAFVLHADTDRHLGAFDPFRREMWLGLGCATANAQLAGPAFGLQATAPIVDAQAGGAGTITMGIRKEDTVPDPLFSALPDRRTNRGAYSTAPVSSELLAAVKESAGEVEGAQVVLMDPTSRAGAAFAKATLRGTGAINADKQMSHDGHVWFRGNARKVAHYRDGVSVPTAGLSPFISVIGQLLPEADTETSGGYWLASTERQLIASGGFGLIMVDDLYDRSTCIAAGQLWQRLHLAFTLHGLAAQPMNQLPELVDRDRHLETDRGWKTTLRGIAGPRGNATFAFRFGVPISDVPHSARRPLEWITA